MIKVRPALDSGQVIAFRMARDLPLLQRYHTAAYWVDGLLIDTGCAHVAPRFLSLLDDWQVTQVVNTHSHEDHIGANAQVQARFDCPAFAHADAVPILRNPALQPLQPYRRLFWGKPAGSDAQAIGEWVQTTHFRFRVIPTPGHSPDSISLFEPDQGWLFTGDAYVGGKDRALRAGFDVYGIIASLKRMAGLPVRTLFAGSGSVRHQATQALQEKADYLEELCARICSLHAQGHSPRSIQRQVLGPELSIAYITLGHFSGRHLVRSCLSGLEPEGVGADSCGNCDPKAPQDGRVWPAP